jgi:hypothetical protein
MNEVGNARRERRPAPRGIVPHVAGLLSIGAWCTHGLEAAGPR